VGGGRNGGGRELPPWKQGTVIIIPAQKNIGNIII